MSNAGKVFAVALVAALAWAGAPVAQAQPPIRIGASLSLTSTYAPLAQNQCGDHQLAVKHLDEKGGSPTAVRPYEELITQDKVDLVLGP